MLSGEVPLKCCFHLTSDSNSTNCTSCALERMQFLVEVVLYYRITFVKQAISVSFTENTNTTDREADI
jgi:hypothetical protein